MYSPKIAEDLIPTLYWLAKHKRKPMTRIVDEILRENLTIDQAQSNVKEPTKLTTE
jgi:hypothetical protein